MPADVAILPSRPGSGGATNNQSAEFDKYLASAERRAASMKIEAETYNIVEAQAARYRTVMELTNLATEKGIVLSDTQSERIQRLGRDVENYTAHLDALKVRTENLTPYKAYGKELERLNYLVNQGALSWEEYEKAAERAAENAGIAWHQTANTIMGAIVAVAKSSGESNKTMSKIAQAAGIAQAIVNTHVRITKALAFAAPPWNFALAAAVAAQGFASVAAIRSQSTSIGSISTPSVSSASNVPAQIPTATNDNTKVQGQGTTIIIEGEKVGYRELEELIRRINEVCADGGPITIRQSGGGRDHHQPRARPPAIICVPTVEPDDRVGERRDADDDLRDEL